MDDYLVRNKNQLLTDIEKNKNLSKRNRLSYIKKN